MWQTVPLVMRSLETRDQNQNWQALLHLAKKI